MGIVFPGETIARRWNGALQARLRRAPLEEFLLAHGIASAPCGTSQDRDNLVRATLLMVDAGIVRYFHECDQDLSATQFPALTRPVCLVSRSLAQLILDPAAWRGAALVSTAQLLSAWMSLSDAAIASAALVRHFEQQLMQPTPPADARLSDIIATTIRGGAQGMAVLSAMIAKNLACAREPKTPGSRVA